MSPYEVLEFSNSYGKVDGVCNLMFGKLIGEGVHRVVYEFAMDKRYVVKVEKEFDTLSNIREFLFWDAIQFTEQAKWLCPIKEMSANGRILIMRKMEPITEKNKHKIPKDVPKWLSDMKHSNYGFIGKQFVCCDYPFSADFAMSNVTKSTKKWKSHLGEK